MYTELGGTMLSMCHSLSMNAEKHTKRTSIIPFAPVMGIILVAVISICSIFIALRHGGAYIVRTGSMNPAIPPGSVIITVAKQRYNVGDVITYTQEDNPIASLHTDAVSHRIIEIRDTSFITKGDANNAPDREPIDQSRVLGHVIVTIPLIGYVLAFLKTKTGIVIGILIPSILILFMQLRTLIHHIRSFHDTRSTKKRPAHISKRPTLLLFFLMILIGASTQSIRHAASLLQSTKPLATNIAKAGRWPTIHCAYVKERNMLSLAIYEVHGWQSASYEILYETQNTTQAILGTIPIGPEDNAIEKSDIYVGTCSSGGTCIPHIPASNIRISAHITNGTQRHDMHCTL